MSAESCKQIRLVTVVMLPERAADFSQAALELGGEISVTVLNPEVPDDVDTYVRTSAKAEVSRYNSEMYGTPKPRTAEQIRREVVESARLGGRVLTIINHPGKNDLGLLWKRADELSAARQPELG